MFDKNKLHLVPPIVQDMAAGTQDVKKSINERSNYVVRLEAIRDFCSWAINRFEIAIKRKKHG